MLLLSLPHAKTEGMREVLIPVEDFIPGGMLFRTTEPYLALCVWGGPHGAIWFHNPKEFPLLCRMATLPAEYRTFRISEAEFLCGLPNIEPTL